MPAALSMIRTVPGGEASGRPAAGPPAATRRPTGSAAPPGRRRTGCRARVPRRPRPRAPGRRARPPAASGCVARTAPRGRGTGCGRGSGGRRRQHRRGLGRRRPGRPAWRRRTSAAPFHQRTMPGGAVGVGVPPGGRLRWSGHGSTLGRRAYGRRAERRCPGHSRRRRRPPAARRRVRVRRGRGAAAAGRGGRLARRAGRDWSGGGWPASRWSTILGWAEFCGLRIAVDPGVFVPRRRTEFLVEEAVALARAGSRGRRPLLRLRRARRRAGRRGRGRRAARGGRRPRRRGAAPGATCRRRRPGATRATCSRALPAALRGRVDVLVANVPYVPTDAIALMPPEARDHEPRVALDGGADGLDVARRVVAGAPGWLAPGGALLFETSEDQAAAAVATVAAAGLAARVVDRRRPRRDRRRRCATGPRTFGTRRSRLNGRPAAALGPGRGSPGDRTMARSSDDPRRRTWSRRFARPAWRSRSADGGAPATGPGGGRGRGARLPRPERRGQDDDDPVPARDDPGDVRAGRDLRRRRAGAPGRGTPAAGLRARRGEPLAGADRRGDAAPAQPGAGTGGPRATATSWSSGSSSTRRSGCGPTPRATGRRCC